jgi:arsenite transporter
MLNFRNYSLLTFTVSARNAPLMLAITAMSFGEQPVLLAAIVVGMLLEFPHLTALTWLLRRRRDREQLNSEVGAGGGGPV